MKRTLPFGPVLSFPSWNTAIARSVAGDRIQTALSLHVAFVTWSTNRRVVKRTWKWASLVPSLPRVPSCRPRPFTYAVKDSRHDPAFGSGDLGAPKFGHPLTWSGRGGAPSMNLTVTSIPGSEKAVRHRRRKVEVGEPKEGVTAALTRRGRFPRGVLTTWPAAAPLAGTFPPPSRPSTRLSDGADALEGKGEMGVGFSVLFQGPS